MRDPQAQRSNEVYKQHEFHAHLCSQIRDANEFFQDILG